MVKRGLYMFIIILHAVSILAIIFLEEIKKKRMKKKEEEEKGHKERSHDKKHDLGVACGTIAINIIVLLMSLDPIVMISFSCISVLVVISGSIQSFNTIIT